MQARTRIKICGITRAEDALAAAALGADAIGFVFYAPSPRNITIDAARDVASVLPPFVSAVGLFVDADRAFIDTVLARVPLAVLQFHGDESPEFCAQFARPFIKAIRMKPELDVKAEIARFPAASGILLDAYRPGVPGGTGETFDWQRVPRQTNTPVVLAGGLTAANVTAAIGATRPWAVDVSGGVEASHGVKDNAKLAAFFAAVRNADKES